ncbi:MAG: 4-(cytidine 5'-diphospho)-2-C-methyl-D-erythritol kinase [Bacillota bacterium]
MIKSVTEKIYAKINLCLAIKGKEKHMHLIDTLITNINVFDEIALKKRNDNKINVVYKNINNKIENDTAKKAALLLQKVHSLPGVDITIKKHIPFSAGLGGSSADAAGVAKCMKKLFSIEPNRKELLLIGSDVPYMFEGGDKRVKGLGENISPVILPNFKYAIVLCPGGVNTKKAYDLYDKIGGENPDVDKIIMNINHTKPCILYNALQKAACQLNPNIQTGLDLLKESGFTQSVMTGSGSAVVGMEKDPEKFKKQTEKLNTLINNNYKLILT